jgi:hypothetical protein
MEKGVSGTGTIMPNRFPCVGLKSEKILKQEDRGSIDSKVREDRKIAVVKWMVGDNGVHKAQTGRQMIGQTLFETRQGLHTSSSP